MLQAFILGHAVADSTAKYREKRGRSQVSSQTADFPLSTLQETEDKKEERNIYCRETFSLGMNLRQNIP